MTALDHRPFAPPIPRGRARIIPWTSVVAGSCVGCVPIVANLPVMPPVGLLMLLSWRLLAPFSLRRWAAAPLGLFDDLVSGQPLGSAVLLWSLVFLGIGIVEQRLVFRDMWQDWGIAACAIAFCVVAGRLIAVPLAAHVDTFIVGQIAVAILLFPVTARAVGWIDRKRGNAT